MRSMPFLPGTERRLRISRYVDDRKIGGDAFVVINAIHTMHWTFHRSFHRGYLPRARGFIAFFRPRNFSSSGNRTCFDSGHKRGRAPFFSYSFIAIDDCSIQIVRFHVHELCPPRKTLPFDRARIGLQILADLSIVRRRRGQNKQVPLAVLRHPGDDEFYERLLTLTSPHQQPLHDSPPW